MPDTSNTRHETGRAGERLAAWFLARRGFLILDRNVRLGRLEIDLVVRKNRQVIFVEVKTRSVGAFGSASRALRLEQRRRIIHAAYRYVRKRAHSNCAIRFDVIAIDESHETLKLEHFVDAFGSGGELR
jgi:putative endonuclease